MKSRRKRKEIRQLARKASSSSRIPLPAPEAEDVSCPCGHAFRLAVGDEGKTFLCPACKGSYKAARADAVLQLFPAGEVPSAALNSTAADTHAATEVVQALGAQLQGPGELDGAIEPESPAQMQFACPCGEELVATKKTYDKRAVCPRCGAKLLVNLIYSATKKAFTIVPVRVG